MDAIGTLISSYNFKQQIEQIQKMAEDELKDAVLRIIYSQPESKWYIRTYTLYKSIKAVDLKVNVDVISFKVIFDEKILRHTTIFGSKKYGLQPDQEVGYRIVPWLNEGWKWSKYSSERLIDNWSFRKPEKFIEEAINQITEKTIRRVKNLFFIEVKKLGFNYK